MAAYIWPPKLLLFLLISLLGSAGGHDERFIVDSHGEVDLQSVVLVLQQEVLMLRKEVDVLKATPIDPDSVYTRWGRTGCPGNDSELVYSVCPAPVGYTEGKLYTETGGGVNYLCLPSDPTWGKFDPGTQTYRGRLYDTEYEVDDDHTKMFDTPIYNEDAPCAVCQIPRKATLRIPARTNCYPGWTEEYTGYLMAMYHGHPASSDYICLDSRPEFVPHGAGNDDESVMYPVEAICGSLSCLPYVAGQELACVVCSK